MAPVLDRVPNSGDTVVHVQIAEPGADSDDVLTERANYRSSSRSPTPVLRLRRPASRAWKATGGGGGSVSYSGVCLRSNVVSSEIEPPPGKMVLAYVLCAKDELPKSQSSIVNEKPPWKAEITFQYA